MPVKIDDRLRNKLNWMMFVCTILIVFFHIVRPENPGWFIRLLCNTLPYLAVPSFFAISGFLLVGHCDKDDWWKSALKKRVGSLLVPFFAVNVLYLPLVFAYHLIPNSPSYHSFEVAWAAKTIANGLGFNPYVFPACNPLWYIRTLLWFVLFSPVIVLLTKRSCLSAIGVTTLIFAAARIFPFLELPELISALFDDGLTIAFFGFFVAGIGLRLWVRQTTRSLTALFAVVGALGLALLWTNMGGWLSWIPAMVGLWMLMPGVPMPKFMIQSAFPIYVLHIGVIFAYKVLFGAIGKSDWLLTPRGTAFCVAMPILISVGVSVVVHKWFPRVSRVLFGNR